MKKYKNDILSILLFIFVVAVFFYPTILQGKLPVPSDTLIGLYHPWRDLYASTNPRGIPFKNFLITDPIRQQIPWRKEAIDQWKTGRIPYWNPFSFSGTPLAANIQAAVFYPFNLLFLIPSFPIAWTILIVLEPLLSGLFLYIYLRNHRLEPLSSLFGAIAWSFSGFTISWLTWGTIVHVALWLPFILFTIDKYLELFSKKWIMLLSVILLFQFFAGHAQISLYEMFIAGAYSIWKIYEKRSRTAVVWFLLAGILFFVFSSIQWVPFLRLVYESSRAVDFSFWQKEGWFLPWQHLVQFIAPDFFGNPTTLNYWGVWNYGELTGYVGIAPLIFAIYALFFGNKDRTRFWGIVLFIAALFILPNPIATIPYQLHVPILSSLQPTRLMIVIDFSLAVLAAYGANEFLRKQSKKFWISMGIVMACFAIAWLVIFSRNIFTSTAVKDGLLVSKRNLFLPSILFFVVGFLSFFSQKIPKKKYLLIVCFLGIIGVTTFDLLHFGWKFTPFTPVAYFFPDTKIISFLNNQQKPFRIMSMDSEIFPPNVSAYYGIESIEGYDPIYLGRYEEFIVASERAKADITPPYGFNRMITPRNIDSPLLPLFNVKYMLSLTDINKPFLTKVFQEGDTRMYEYKKSLPRVYFVDNVLVVKDKQQILDALFQKTFDPTKTAIVETSVSPFHSSPEDTIHISNYTVSSIIMNATVKNDRFLVVSNLFDPGWEILIDGKKGQVYRTNYTFLGLLVPSGSHTIQLTYK